RGRRPFLARGHGVTARRGPYGGRGRETPRVRWTRPRGPCTRWCCRWAVPPFLPAGVVGRGGTGAGVARGISRPIGPPVGATKTAPDGPEWGGRYPRRVHPPWWQVRTRLPP